MLITATDAIAETSSGTPPPAVLVAPDNSDSTATPSEQIPPKPANSYPFLVKVTDFYGVQGVGYDYYLNRDQIIVAGWNDFGKPPTEVLHRSLTKKQREQCKTLLASLQIKDLAAEFVGPGTDGLQQTFEFKLGDEEKRIQVSNSYVKDLARLSKWINTILPERFRMNVQRKVDPIVAQMAAEARKGKSLCAELAGFKTLEKLFTIQNPTCSLASGRGTLHVVLRAKASRTLDTVVWDNPYTARKDPQDWYDLMHTHMEAEKEIGKFSWVGNWKQGSVGRSLELRLRGDKIEPTGFDSKIECLPAWKHAGFLQPTVRIIARNKDLSYIDMYFGNEETRALVVTTSDPDPNATVALDRIDVSWRPGGETGERSSRYAVVEQDGRCTEYTYVTE